MDTIRERAEAVCREAGIDPSKKDPPLEDIRTIMLHVARQSGTWRFAGLALVDQLNAMGGSNAEKYCALCFALGLITAQEPRLGDGLRFAAPLVADELIRSD